MASRLLWSNNATATLRAAVGTGDLIALLTSGQGSRFPAPAAGQYLKAYLKDGAGNFEVVHVSAISTDDLTITRAQEGTSARAFSAGDTLSLRMTKGTLEAFTQRDADETVTGLWTFNSMAASLLTLGSRAAPVPPGGYGHCYLQWAATNQLTLAPYNGDTIFINGRFYQLGAGVTATFSPAANTTYYVYAYVVSGTTIGLELDPVNGPALSGTYNGLKIKNGVGTRTLVGMARTNASSQFYDIATGTTPGADIGVISWFNRRRKACRKAFGSDALTSSAAWIELNSANRVSFLAWAEDAVRVHAETSAQSTSAALYALFGVGVDSTSVALSQTTQYHAGSAQHRAQAADAAFIPTEGLHYATALGGVAGVGTAQYFASYTAVSAEVMG